MRLDEPAQWQTVPAEPPGPLDPVPPFRRPRPKRRGWRRPFGLRWQASSCSASLAIFMLLVAWLAITAPLSKSLQPIAAPSLTLLSVEGQPIARRGAEIGAAGRRHRAAANMSPAAFVSIEDRGFYHHFGIEPCAASPAPPSATRRRAACARAAARSPSSSPRPASSAPSGRPGRKAQEVLIAFWLEAWLEQGRDPRAAISRTSISATMSTACAPPPGIISTIEPGAAHPRRRRRCWRAW